MRLMSDKMAEVEKRWLKTGGVKREALIASAIYWQEAASLAHRMQNGSYGSHAIYWQANARFAHKTQAEIVTLLNARRHRP